jgi:hypothetical protein
LGEEKGCGVGGGVGPRDGVGVGPRGREGVGPPRHLPPPGFSTPATMEDVYEISRAILLSITEGELQLK